MREGPGVPTLGLLLFHWVVQGRKGGYRGGRRGRRGNNGDFDGRLYDVRFLLLILLLALLLVLLLEQLLPLDRCRGLQYQVLQFVPELLRDGVEMLVVFCVVDDRDWKKYATEGIDERRELGTQDHAPEYRINNPQCHDRGGPIAGQGQHVPDIEISCTFHRRFSHLQQSRHGLRER